MYHEHAIYGKNVIDGSSRVAGFLGEFRQESGREYAWETVAAALFVERSAVDRRVLSQGKEQCEPPLRGSHESGELLPGSNPQ